MILLLDTSSPLCQVTLVDNDQTFTHEWQADRTLARFLLKYLHDCLAEHGWEWSDIMAIGVMSGPGSFTGLRIGLTVVNTIAAAQTIPIVGATGEQWQATCLARLQRGETDRVVMPQYGSEAHITTPRK